MRPAEGDPPMISLQMNADSIMISGPAILLLCATTAAWQAVGVEVVMKRILLTGMSGTGKSTLISELAARGYKAVDVDCDEFSERMQISGDAGSYRHRWTSTGTGYGGRTVSKTCWRPRMPRCCS